MSIDFVLCADCLCLSYKDIGDLINPLITQDLLGISRFQINGPQKQLALKSGTSAAILMN